MRALATALLALSTGAATTAVAQADASRMAFPQPGEWRLGVEALRWRFKESPIPVPLVTDGYVGRPDTKTFLGGQDLDTGGNPGLRLSGDYVLDGRRGLEANVFHFKSRATDAGVSSSGRLGSTDLILPYLDAVTRTETGTEISYAPLYSGTAREELANDLRGAEFNGTWALAPVGAWKVDLIGGLRYWRLHEKYRFTTSSPFIPPHPQDIWETTDEFDTANSFYGAQGGLRARFDEGAFFAHATVKVALGAMVQRARIDGSLVTNDFTNYGPTQVYAGGYFALPTNMGQHERTVFAAVPEAGLNLGYRISPAATVFAGYSLVYASRVIRPGNQVNRTINTTQSVAHTEDPDARLSGPAEPSYRYAESRFWSQGLNVGFAWRF